MIDLQTIPSSAVTAATNILSICSMQLAVLLHVYQSMAVFCTTLLLTFTVRVIYEYVLPCSIAQLLQQATNRVESTQ